MALQYIVTGAITVILLIPSSTMYVYAGQPEETQVRIEGGSELFYREDGYPRDTKNRPAINPDFAPDESCDLKWELKCIPGSQQSCFDELEGFNNGEMNVCTPIGCPEGYHDIYEDEDNICHSNEIDCPNDWPLVSKDYGDQCNPNAS